VCGFVIFGCVISGCVIDFGEVPSGTGFVEFELTRRSFKGGAERPDWGVALPAPAGDALAKA
jgi:hypothetical protein